MSGVRVVSGPEQLSDLVAQAIDNLMYEGQYYGADWLDEVTGAVMAEVDPVLAAEAGTIEIEGERWRPLRDDEEIPRRYRETRLVPLESLEES